MMKQTMMMAAAFGLVLFATGVAQAQAPAPAQPPSQIIEVGAQGGVSFNYVATHPDGTISGTTYSTAAVPTFGVYGMMPLTAMFGVESGLYFVPRKFSVVTAGAAGGSYEEVKKQIIMPFLLRVSPIPMLQLGAGPYLGMATGTISRTGTIGGVAAQPDTAYNDTTEGTLDSGFMLSAKVKFPITPMFNVVGDLRYLRGFKDVDTRPAVVVYYRQLALLAGVSIDL